MMTGTLGHHRRLLILRTVPAGVTSSHSFLNGEVIFKNILPVLTYTYDILHTHTHTSADSEISNELKGLTEE